MPWYYYYCRIIYIFFHIMYIKDSVSLNHSRFTVMLTKRILWNVRDIFIRSFHHCPNTFVSYCTSVISPVFSQISLRHVSLTTLYKTSIGIPWGIPFVPGGTAYLPSVLLRRRICVRVFGVREGAFVYQKLDFEASVIEFQVRLRGQPLIRLKPM